MTRHLRNALRVATSWPLFFWSVVVILALGVGANTAVFAALRAVLIDPPAYRDPDTVVVFRQFDHFAPAPLAASDIPELEQLRGLANVAGCSASSLPMLPSRPSVLAAPIEVTQSFFELFGLPPLVGRALVASDFQGGALGRAVLRTVEVDVRRRLGCRWALRDVCDEEASQQLGPAGDAEFSVQPRNVRLNRGAVKYLVGP